MPRILVHPLEERDDHLRRDEVVARQPRPVRLDVAARLDAPGVEDLLRRRPSGARPSPVAPPAAPIAFSSVSAYRFWLTFIIVVAISRSGGDWDSTMRGRGGAVARTGSIARDTTGIPRTGMPRSISASVSA